MKTLHVKNTTHLSRRTLLAGGLAAGSAPLLAASDAQASAKLTKASVRYTQTAKNGHDCRSCKLFLQPSNCMFVDGALSPDGSCWIWRGKDA